MTVKVIEPEKVTRSDMKSLKTFRFSQEFTTHDKYSLLSRDNSMQTIQMHLSRKQKTFSEFLCAFLKCTANFEHFQKKMTLIAYEFPKLQTPKNVVR